MNDTISLFDNYQKMWELWFEIVVETQMAFIEDWFDAIRRF